MPLVDPGAASKAKLKAVGQTPAKLSSQAMLTRPPWALLALCADPVGAPCARKDAPTRSIVAAAITSARGHQIHGATNQIDRAPMPFATRVLLIRTDQEIRDPGAGHVAGSDPNSRSPERPITRAPARPRACTSTIVVSVTPMAGGFARSIGKSEAP